MERQVGQEQMIHTGDQSETWSRDPNQNPNELNRQNEQKDNNSRQDNTQTQQSPHSQDKTQTADQTQQANSKLNETLQEQTKLNLENKQQKAEKKENVENKTSTQDEGKQAADNESLDKIPTQEEPCNDTPPLDDHQATSQAESSKLSQQNNSTQNNLEKAIVQSHSDTFLTKSLTFKLLIVIFVVAFLIILKKQFAQARRCKNGDVEMGTERK